MYPRKILDDHSPKVYAFVMEPLSAPSCTGMAKFYKFRPDEQVIEKDEIEEFPFDCKRVLKIGEFVVSLCEHFLINIWISAFSSTGFIVMLYQ